MAHPEERAANRRLYPVIVACMGENRPPTIAEVAHVAKRIRREAFPEVCLNSEQRHEILLTALVALGL